MDSLPSFMSVASDGVVHIAGVRARPGTPREYEVTSEIVVTDALSPNAYVFGGQPDESPTVDSAPGLTDDALRLIAGTRALQIHLEFTTGYAPFAETFGDEPRDDNSGFDDDDLDADEGVFL